jgi:2-polyprenyl-3-methyl-5-hydroxy-6-metoxy-1,4-benzoquinol methylase
MNTKDLKAKASTQRWFNAIDFGEFQARGREASGATYFNGSLFGVFDLLSHIRIEGRRCIDIGSGSGLVALGLKKLGAAYVAAADGIHHPAFDTAREITGLEVDYRLIGVEHVAAESDWQGSFDLVVSSGLMYHLINPFELIHAAKRLLKPQGLFLLQSYCKRTDPAAALYLNSERNVNGDPTTYFVPGINALRGMLKLGVFEVLAERTLTDYSEFVAFLARSESDPNLVSQRATNTATIHERLMSNPSYNFGGYSFADFVRARDGKSSIEVSPLEAHRQIKEDSFDCRFPLNPRKLTNPIGAKYR